MSESSPVNQLPSGCPATVEHALVHINSAIDCPGDVEQIKHDLDRAQTILMVVLGRTTREHAATKDV